MCDNMQPFMLNHATGGRSWQEHGVKKSQVLNRNRYLEDGSKTMKQYFDEIIEEHVKEGNLKDE